MFNKSISNAADECRRDGTPVDAEICDLLKMDVNSVYVWRQSAFVL
jgi:hypothetical protein